MEVTPSPLSGLMRPDAYQRRNAHLFPHAGSMHWFVRQHRTELAKARALLKVANRQWIDAPLFDAYVLAVATGATAS